MRLLLCSLSLVLSGLACAADVVPMSAAEKQQKLARAAALKEESARIEREADARYRAEQKACYEKFLAASCLEEAKKQHTQASREASRRGIEGGELEREVRRNEVAVRDAQRAAEAPKRVAEQQAQGEAFRDTEAKKADARAAKIAEKQKQAAEGRKQRAEDQARQERKLKEHAEKQAKAAEKRKAREAERAARQAEKERQSSVTGAASR